MTQCDVCREAMPPTQVSVTMHVAPHKHERNQSVEVTAIPTSECEGECEGEWEGECEGEWEGECEGEWEG